MKRKVMACLVSASMLMTVLSPVVGTFADDPATPSDVNVASATEEVFLAPETAAMESTDAPAATPAPSAEQTSEPSATEEVTAEPSIEPSAEPSIAPLAESTVESTAEPETTPSAEETTEPTVEPSVEPTAEPSVEPTAEPSAEPTVEPSVEPTVEPTEEPAEETPAVPEMALAANVTLNKTYAFANEEGVTVMVDISGGFAPYEVTMQVMSSTNTYEQSAASAQAGLMALYYMPAEFGVHTFEITVTDASGAVYVTGTSLPVASRSDVEYAADWESTVKNVKLTGDWRKDLIAIAETQLGYQESEYNFIIDENGKKQGFTRYGAWYGATYSDWCAMFVAFCMNYAEIPESDVPRDAHCEILRQKMSSAGAYENDEDTYEPKPGDLVFFAFEEKNVPDHVGIVVRVSGNTIETIEGNSNKAVHRNGYSRDDEHIIGYANMETLMRRAGVLEAEVTAAPEATAEPETTAEPEATQAPEATAEPTPTAAPEMKESEDGDTEITIAEIEGLVVQTQPLAYAWQQGSTTLTFAVQNAVSYQWQTALYTDGEPAWSDVPDGNTSELSTTVSVENAKYMFRCVATAANGMSVISSNVTLVTPDVIGWINEGNVTMEMLNRAMSARSIDSMMLENNTLVYVRNGKVYARYNAATGAVTDEETGLVVAYIDARTGMMYPVSAGE